MSEQRYIVDGTHEVFVVRDSGRTERPNPEECAALDRYFASPQARDETGAFWDLCGEAIKGVDGDVVMFPYRIG